MRYIRKGTSRVTIPFQLRSSSKAMAQWANQVRQGMLELRDRIPQANVRRGGGGGGTSEPFWTSIRTKPGSPPESPTYQAVVSLGYVEYQNKNSEESTYGTTGWVVPSIGGVEMDANLSNPAIEIPALDLTGTTNYIYLVVKTESDGDLKFGIEDCTVKVFQELQQSEHHVRASPGSGETEGTYYFLLADTTEVPDSSPPRPKINRRITGNRFIPNQLIEIANLAGEDPVANKEFELYKGYKPEEDKHEFRVLKQVGDGGAILKPTSGDPSSDINDQVKVRSVKAYEGGQLTMLPVQDDDENIEFRGNEYNKFVTDGVREINVTDGLVTDVVGFTGASNLNLKVLQFNYTNNFMGSGSAHISQDTSYEEMHYWRNGRYVGQELPEAAGDPPPDGLIEQTVINLQETT